MITFDPALSVVVPTTSASGVSTKTLTVTELPLVIIDVQRSKVCKVQSAPFYKTITLWEGEAYDAIGEYTQSQAEARLLELLGSDPAAELTKLYIEPPKQN